MAGREAERPHDGRRVERPFGMPGSERIHTNHTDHPGQEARASGWAPAFGATRSPWDRREPLAPPVPPEGTRWRAWGGRGRDRGQRDGGWSRKDRRAQRKYARDDQRYYDYDRLDSGVPAPAPPYKEEESDIYGAPEEPKASELDYSEPSRDERVDAPKRERKGSRWDVPPREMEQERERAVHAPLDARRDAFETERVTGEQESSSTPIKTEGEARPLEGMAVDESSRAARHNDSGSDGMDLSEADAGEAPGRDDEQHEAERREQEQRERDAQAAERAQAEQQEAERKEAEAQASEREAQAAEREAQKQAERDAEQAKRAAEQVRIADMAADADRQSAQPKTPKPSASVPSVPRLSDPPSLANATSAPSNSALPAFPQDTPVLPIRTHGEPVPTTPLDPLKRAVVGEPPASAVVPTHAPVGASLEWPAEPLVKAPAEALATPLHPTEPQLHHGPVVPTTRIETSVKRPTLTVPPAKPVPSVSLPLDDEAIEKKILATERALQSAEDGRVSNTADAVPASPTSSRDAMADSAMADSVDEQLMAEGGVPATTPVGESIVQDTAGHAVSEETAAEVHALAKQLIATYPLSTTHVTALLDENRRAAASITVPAVLAHERAPTEWPECKTSVLEASAEKQRAERAAKVAALKAEYRTLNAAWKKYCEHLDKVYERREMQRRASVSGHEEEPANAQSALATPLAARTSRRGAGAGFGDAVRSEAEFLEILASLENAEMQDPVTRAARTAATAPDMAVRVAGDLPLIDHDNGYVADPVDFYFGGYDPDVWSDEEQAIFTKRYALYPKQFGRIARGLPHKTMQQCVAFYYLHKHLPGNDFKALSTRSRERKRKSKTRPKKAKGSALMADMAGPEEPEGDEEEKTPKRRLDEDKKTPGAKRPRTKPRTPEAAEPVPTQAEERDLAAAEALEALAGIAPAPKKRPRPRPKRDENEEPKSRSRGPHWSMTERAEFLRLLALHGKDWAALATAFPAKTAAQTRNFFARHASESSHFQAAAALAVENVALPYEKRSAAAVEFVNGWYAQLSDEAKASVEGWPADPAAFLAPADEDETDDEAAAPPPPPEWASQPYAYPPRPSVYYREGYERFPVYNYGYDERYRDEYREYRPEYRPEPREYRPEYRPEYVRERYEEPVPVLRPPLLPTAPNMGYFPYARPDAPYARSETPYARPDLAYPRAELPYPRDRIHGP